MKLRKMLAVLLAIGMMTAILPGTAETTTSIEDSQKLDAAYTLVLNSIAAQDYAAAKDYLDICFVYCDVNQNPEMYADLLLKRAIIHVYEEKYDMAVLSLDAALRIQPDLADAHLVHAQIYATQGQVDEAIQSLEKYIELSRDDAMYETVAQLYEVSGNMEAAQAAYEKYAAGAGAESVESGFQTGLYRMGNGRYEDAIRAFEAYAEDETYGAGALYNIGVCRMNLGEYAEAVAAFLSCEEKGGTYEGLYYNRGVCRLLAQDWQNAITDFEKSIETEPYVSDARYNMGLCQTQLEDYAAAIATFTELIGDGADAKADAVGAEKTAYDGAYYYRAMCYATTGNLEGALADFTVCIEHGYEPAQSYYQRAQVYGALGDTEKQNADLQNSLKTAN